jgi:hypothetical protein
VRAGTVTCACCHRELSEAEAHYRVAQDSDLEGVVTQSTDTYCPECFGLIVRSQPS